MPNQFFLPHWQVVFPCFKHSLVRFMLKISHWGKKITLKSWYIDLLSLQKTQIMFFFLKTFLQNYITRQKSKLLMITAYLWLKKFCILQFPWSLLRDIFTSFSLSLWTYNNCWLLGGIWPVISVFLMRFL